jgi:bifunctional DNA-binding transcriptional regulator/antitoxin component of YhaV-PrlF toxin-antitoxin module
MTLVKVREVARCLVITIPSSVRKKLLLKEGMEADVDVQEETGTVTIRFYTKDSDELRVVKPILGRIRT